MTPLPRFLARRIRPTLATLAFAAIQAQVPLPTAGAASLPEEARAAVAGEFAALNSLYQDLHRHPELSFHERETAGRIAAEWERAGLEVTRNFGGFGVVGLLRNGNGPTILLRADLDALPVKEQTELPYASQVRVTDDEGKAVDVMHACGHDVHLTVLTGTARMLARFRDRWRGNALLIAQPAEERGNGARMMLKAGLYERFPRPQFGVALHVKADLPAGSVGTIEGPALANVDMVDIVIPGVGGHGAWPHTAKDPVVLAAQAILAYQTIVSRETEPGQAAVVTVGSVHGGSKHNIIPDEVRLELTLRSFSDQVRSNTLSSIGRITRNLALAAGMPTNRLPTVQLRDEFTPVLVNDPELTRRLRSTLTNWFDATRVVTVKPVMGGEDFSEFGRTPEKVPLCLLWLGAIAPDRYEAAQRTGETLPPLHSSRFAPLPEPAIKTGILTLTAVVLESAPAH